jgi:putative ABC transport system ATP-binding protein
MLRIESLHKRFGPRTLLDGLDLALSAGDYVAVMGESGAGKSTLLNLIAGLDVADGGRIVLAGAPVHELPEDERTRLRRDRIGFVFQAFHVLPHLTLAQNVMLPLVLCGVAAAERDARARSMLDAVGLGSRAGDWPAQLSGGELQRVAIARALVHRPALVLADEPTGNLDPETADAVLGLLARTVRAGGAAGILVTHSSTAAATTDRVFRLERGRLVAASGFAPAAASPARPSPAPLAPT